MRGCQHQRGPKAPVRWPRGSGSHEGPFLLSGLGRALSAHTDQAGNAGIARPDRGGTVPNQSHHIWMGGLCLPLLPFPLPPTCLPRALDSAQPDLRTTQSRICRRTRRAAPRPPGVAAPAGIGGPWGWAGSKFLGQRPRDKSRPPGPEGKELAEEARPEGKADGRAERQLRPAPTVPSGPGHPPGRRAAARPGLPPAPSRPALPRAGPLDGAVWAPGRARRVLLRWARRAGPALLSGAQPSPACPLRRAGVAARSPPRGCSSGTPPVAPPPPPPAALSQPRRPPARSPASSALAGWLARRRRKPRRLL